MTHLPLLAIRHPQIAVSSLLTHFTWTKRLCKLTGTTPEEINVYIEDLGKCGLVNHVTSQMPQGDPRWMRIVSIIYFVCRILKPDRVVETGVADGVTSAFILQALEDNDKGLLHSIDLPNTPGNLLPPGKKTGWMIPNKLRDRWNLIIGSSSEKLIPLLEDLKKIDAFLHDSEHTYENMIWEYRAAYPFIRQGGLLLSDDVHRNNAFTDFAKSMKVSPVNFYLKFACLRKPD